MTRAAIKIFLVLALTTGIHLTVLGQVPHTIVMDGKALEKNRQLAAAAKDEGARMAIDGVIKEADKVIRSARTYSVMNKAQTPPSGDKHDYMSQGPYWWPDPTKPDGLPYVRRDGQRNPEISKIIDAAEMGGMLDDVQTLSLAYFFSHDEKYAARAATLIRAWFIDAKTKQNPNLNFGQSVPGISRGRGIGLIETRRLYRVIDSAALIDASRSWTKGDRDGLKTWFAEFLRWMLESPVGKDEADELNNHGTHYDVQVVAYSIYTDRRDLALKQLEVTKGRIRSQIEADGSQPRELARTLSWNYSNMNLQGFFTLARLAESVGVDLWSYETPDGRGIRKAFEFLLPYIKNEKEWAHQQIKPRSFDQTVNILDTAALKYRNPGYTALPQDLDKKNAKNYAEILGH